MSRISGGGGTVLAELLHEVQHDTFLFPEDTNETVTCTAAAANTWLTWTELVDNNAVTFSSKLATTEGHISAFVVETVTANGEIYLVEISYGGSKVNIARVRLYGGAVPKQESRVFSDKIPAGETVYYRAKCSAGGPASLTAHLRYHFH